MKCFILTTNHLNNRKKYIDTIIQYINNDFDVEVINKDIEYTDKIKLQQVGIEEFDNSLTTINKYMADNIERHRFAYNLMNENETYLILEDDNVMLNDHIDNVKEFIKNKDIIMEDYDIGFIGLSIQSESHSKIKLINYRLTGNPNIIASKAAYMITGKFAKKLYENFNMHNYSMRVQLSKYLYDNIDIKVGIINKHVFIEGSKIGVLPSSFNKNNLLIFNPDYINLLKLMNSSDNIKEAESIFQRLNGLNSVDSNHLMGIFYHKNNMNEKAFEHFETAFQLLKEQKGYLGKDSEILNNCINIYQYNQ
jgi:GR25 family glycosyltransferase involved in LPS biosynthesis